LDTSELVKWIFRDAAAALHLNDESSSARAAIKQWMYLERAREGSQFIGEARKFFIYELLKVSIIRRHRMERD
jgi:hypothetical protein